VSQGSRSVNSYSIYGLLEYNFKIYTDYFIDVMVFIQYKLLCPYISHIFYVYFMSLHITQNLPDF